MLEQDYIRYVTKAGATSPCLYFANMHEHTMDIASAVSELGVNVVSFFVSDWDDDLTPWPAPGLYKGDADFKGNAGRTLDGLLGTLIPEIEHAEGLSPCGRAIGGYSLGGLFATYAFLGSDAFRAMASMSGSLWYEGWPGYMAKACGDGSKRGAFDGRFAYFSVGSKERKSPPRILGTVEERNRDAAEMLRASGAETEFYLGPGNHYEHMLDRCKRGIAAVDAFFRHAPAPNE